MLVTTSCPRSRSRQTMVATTVRRRSRTGRRRWRRSHRRCRRRCRRWFSGCRIILRDAGFHLTGQSPPTSAPLSEDAATETGEDRDPGAPKPAHERSTMVRWSVRTRGRWAGSDADTEQGEACDNMPSGAGTIDSPSPPWPGGGCAVRTLRAPGPSVLMKTADRTTRRAGSRPPRASESTPTSRRWRRRRGRDDVLLRGR